MKKCFKCGTEKPLEEFYKHPQTADGHLGKCKECTKRDVKHRYVASFDKVQAYERQRKQTPHRKAKRLEYQAKSRRVNAEKWSARRKVKWAVDNGKLIKLPCEKCGAKPSQAHHTDYSKPLDVQWLCFQCHRVYGHGQRVI